MLAIYEYAALIVVIPQNETQQRPGRPKNARYEFDPRHPLSESHEQLLRSQPVIPILAGAPHPPSPVGFDSKAGDTFAEYFLVLFVPCDADSRGPDM